MSFTSLLIDTGTTRRWTSASNDTYGQPVKTWADYLVDQPCRLYPTQEREITLGNDVYVSNYGLFIGAVDILERDRIVISGRTFEILDVMDRRDADGAHHIECALREIHG